MTAAIKAKAGSLSAALGLAAPDKPKHAAALAVHLSGDSERLRISASDVAATIAVSVEAEATARWRCRCKSSRIWWPHFPPTAQVEIRASDNAAVVACGRSKFRLPIFPIADLPARHVLGPETGRVDLEARTVRDLISRLSFAVGTESTRFYLTGIFLGSVEGDLIAIATDGLRLAQLAQRSTRRSRLIAS